MLRRPPRATQTDTLFPYTTLFRSKIVTDAEAKRGALAKIYPLPRWNVMPPSDVFRVFERGGRNINTQFPEIGLPNPTGSIQRLEEPGRPDLKQSNRGPGTGLRRSEEHTSELQSLMRIS